MKSAYGQVGCIFEAKLSKDRKSLIGWRKEAVSVQISDEMQIMVTYTFGQWSRLIYQRAIEPKAKR